MRQDEEKNWTLALSGELSGPRRAAIGAVKGVVETQHMFEDEHEEEMYTSMYKGDFLPPKGTYNPPSLLHPSLLPSFSSSSSSSSLSLPPSLLPPCSAQ